MTFEPPGCGLGIGQDEEGPKRGIRSKLAGFDGFALCKNISGGLYWTGELDVGIGHGPMWTRSIDRARIFQTRQEAYSVASCIQDLQECRPVSITRAKPHRASK